MFATVVGSFWVWWKNRGKESSSLFKMAIGVIIMGWGFFFMSAASIEYVPERPLPPINSSNASKKDEDSPAKATDTENSKVNGIFTVETENFVHQTYETTDEIKALTQEVIKTIRDIIVSIR